MSITNTIKQISKQSKFMAEGFPSEVESLTFNSFDQIKTLTTEESLSTKSKEELKIIRIAVVLFSQINESQTSQETDIVISAFTNLTQAINRKKDYSQYID